MGEEGELGGLEEVEAGLGGSAGLCLGTFLSLRVNHTLVSSCFGGGGVSGDLEENSCLRTLRGLGDGFTQAVTLWLQHSGDEDSLWT